MKRIILFKIIKLYKTFLGVHNSKFPLEVTVDRLSFSFLSDRFIQQRLGGPSKAEYEKLQSEMADLQVKYDELLATHKETCKEVVSN